MHRKLFVNMSHIFIDFKYFFDFFIFNLIINNNLLWKLHQTNLLLTFKMAAFTATIASC